MRTSVSKLQKQLGTTTVYVTHDQTEAMTLGDRVVVMRSGLVQQIGSPQFLYEQPVNLFVAGFIGSPSMNFVPARLENNEVASPLGSFRLTDRIRTLLEDGDASREVIMGLRPEHFEDAALLDESAVGGGATFESTVDVLESMGSDKFAYFTVEGEVATSAELDELAADAGSAEMTDDGTQIVTRLSASSQAKEGSDARIWFDTDKIHLFDPKTGRNFTYSE